MLYPRKQLVVISLIMCLASFAGTTVFQRDDYMRHVKYLASDELQGRGNGTPELDRAAEYIATQFRSYGVEPAGEEGFFQRFTVTTGSRLGPGNKMTIYINGHPIEAALHKDFVPFAIGDKTDVSGNLVFAGYGITAEEHQYDDYKDVDVTDKIVLVMTHEPRELDPKNSPLSVNGPTLLGQDNTKAINAKYRNAKAILIVQDPANHEDSASDLPDPAIGTQVDDLGICAVRISRDLAGKLLGADNRKLLDLQHQIDEKIAPQTFDLPGVRIDLEMDVAKVRKEVRNVIGFLPATGSDASDEFIILGAHYDHLGRGGRNSMSPQLIGQVHHGADDNASGTAGLLEIAAAMARDAAPRRRGYLFIAFAGEEIGLLGSSYWTRNPTKPIDKAIAMMNMDMIGRSRDNQVLLSGVGTSPVFPKLVERAAADAGLTVRTSQSGYGSSDHTEFYIKNIPVLYFFVGLHADYHRPSDTWEKINSEAAVKILSMVYEIAVELDSSASRPLFTKVDEPLSRGGGGSGYGAYFGSIPDMTDDVAGVRFSDVRPNSPAAKAGLRAQDILITFEGHEIKNLEDFTYMLRTHRAGQTVTVTVLRDGKPMTAQVTLEVRR